MVIIIGGYPVVSLSSWKEEEIPGTGRYRDQAKYGDRQLSVILGDKQSVTQVESQRLWANVPPWYED